MYEKILVVTAIKFEVMVSKNGHILKSLSPLSSKLLKPTLTPFYNRIVASTIKQVLLVSGNK